MASLQLCFVFNVIVDLSCLYQLVVCWLSLGMNRPSDLRRENSAREEQRSRNKDIEEERREEDLEDVSSFRMVCGGCYRLSTYVRLNERNERRADAQSLAELSA